MDQPEDGRKSDRRAAVPRKDRPKDMMRPGPLRRHWLTQPFGNLPSKCFQYAVVIQPRWTGMVSWGLDGMPTIILLVLTGLSMYYCSP